MVLEIPDGPNIRRMKLVAPALNLPEIYEALLRAGFDLEIGEDILIVSKKAPADATAPETPEARHERIYS